MGKQKKQKPAKVPKTVRARSKPIQSEVVAEMSALWDGYGKCYNYFAERFGGIHSMELIQSFPATRDKIRREQAVVDAAHGHKKLEETYGFLNRHWVMALSHCCASLKSMWTNLGNRCKTFIRENKNLSEEERSYCCYIFSAIPQWHAVLEYQDPHKNATDTFSKLITAVNPSRFHYLHSLIRRITRKYRPAKPSMDTCRCILLDEVMYRVYEDGGKWLLEFASATPRKRYTVELGCPYTYAKGGNIQLILDREARTVEIHKCIQAKVRTSVKTVPVGIDKGFATLLSCSDDREYGKDAGRLIYAESERINLRNTNRNRTIQYHKELVPAADRLEKQAKTAGSRKERTACLGRASALEKKKQNVARCNLGNKKYSKQHLRKTEEMESAVNHSILEMIRGSKPSMGVKEDLTFTRKKGQGPTFNRAMSSWTKGTMDGRLSYIFSTYGIPLQDVNPAYTSQYCPVCGEPTVRSGKHREVATCPIHGKMNANTNAAKVILSRLDDPEITLYTPYQKVKDIMESRRKKNQGQNPVSTAV